MEEDDHEPVVEGSRDGNSAKCLDENDPKSPSLVAAVAELPRKQKRKELKKEKRKQKRKEAAEKARQEEEARLNDPEEQRRIQLEEEREKERLEQERREFEEKERLFLEALARKKAQEEAEESRRRAEEAQKLKEKVAECETNEDDEWEYVEEGPPQIIWQGNEIIVKKNKVKVKKKALELQVVEEDPDRPTSNPLLPQSEAFADYRSTLMPSAQQLLQNVAQQVPNFGTEQDKAHCPFHLKTGACRFGPRCSRVHFYPDRSCTLLIKNMYSGPGLAWEQDEGLEYTDEEVERSYEEFYEDVHTEFLKFGEIVNFKVCRNGSYHLRGNVYVHYVSVDDAVLAFQAVNGRYFAGKQVSCEFVSVTKWKVAICGEYMKSRLKTCSRGTACNFIHCFRNPGGDYEWADWDKPPPKYWVTKMTTLFGYSHEYERSYERESPRHHGTYSGGRFATNEQRHGTRRSQSTERKSSNRSPRNYNEKDESQSNKFSKRRRSDDAMRPDTYEREYEEEQYSTSRGHEKKRRQHGSESDEDRPDRYHDGDRYHDQRRKTSKHLDSPDGRETRWSGTFGTLSELSDRGIDGEKHHKHPKKRSRKQESVYTTNERSYDTDSSREHSYENRRSLSSKDHMHRKRRIYGSDSTGYSTDENAQSSHGRRRKSKTRRHEVSEVTTDQQDSGKSLDNKQHRTKSSRKDYAKQDEIDTGSLQQPDSANETRKRRKKSHGKSRSHDRIDEHWEESRSRSRSKRKSSSRKMDSDEDD